MIDPAKVTKEEMMKLMKGGIPSKDQLTTDGVVRYQITYVSFVVGSAFCLGVIVYHELLK